MQKRIFGDLDVVLAGGSDREGGGDGPLVVLFHGFGAPGEDLVPLFRALSVPADVRFAFPAGPLELFGGGMDARAWWHIDVMRYQEAIATNQLEALAHAPSPDIEGVGNLVEAALSALVETLSVPPGKLVIGGFSQGAMLATQSALHTAQSLGGLVLLSGALMTADVWQPRFAGLKDVPVFQAHGEEDPVVPFVMGEMLHQGIAEHATRCAFHRFRGGHEIPGAVLESLGSFLTDITGA